MLLRLRQKPIGVWIKSQGGCKKTALRSFFTTANPASAIEHRRFGMKFNKNMQFPLPKTAEVARGRRFPDHLPRRAVNNIELFYSPHNYILNSVDKLAWLYCGNFAVCKIFQIPCDDIVCFYSVSLRTLNGILIVFEIEHGCFF